MPGVAADNGRAEIRSEIVNVMKKRANEAWKFLVPLISPWDFGWKWDGGIARPTKSDLIEAFNAKRHGRYKWTLKRMSAHFSGERTLYFAADGSSRAGTVLGMIDIDCHEQGCLEYALAFADHLKTFLPTLYVEPSTNGKGVHGYFLLEKGGFGDRYARTLFANLQVWAEDEYDIWQAANPDKPIDGVEIKGSPARLKWSSDGRLEDMTMGTLAKLPRQVVDRFDEFRATARISIRTLKDLLGQVVLGEGLTGKFVRERLGRPRAPAAVVSAPMSSSKKKTAVKRGSTAGHPVGERYLQRLPVYRKVAEALMDGPIPTSGRAVASVEDVAIFVMLLVAFGENPNADDSMPTKRFKAVWESIHERGEVYRPWNPNRFTAIRNHLSMKSMLRWIDDRHVEGFMGDNGEYVKGRAAKWAAGRKLVELIETTAGREGSEGGEEEHLSYNKDDVPAEAAPVRVNEERVDLNDNQVDESYGTVLRLFDDSFMGELREEYFTRPTRCPGLWGDHRLVA
jgi:hypothetical protein